MESVEFDWDEETRKWEFYRRALKMLMILDKNTGLKKS
jgi:hypothetical protein